jgi:Protein of unknown function (DUF3370)
MKFTPLILFVLSSLTIGVPSCIQREASKAGESPSPTTTAPQEIIRSNEVRSLPGKLDGVPMFNSNSPEWIKTEGILLSTFPPTGKRVPTAHLNFPFLGQFTLFAHHFTHTPPHLQTLYLGVVVHNPSQQPVTLSVSEAASYLLEPDAPFKQQPAMSENPRGEIYSGPGIRAVDRVLRGQRQADFPDRVVIPPQTSRMLMNLPIPVRGLAKPVNGRSSFLRLNSSGTVYVASLAMYAQKNADGSDRAPTLQEWQQLLETGGLAGPRDKTPTPPDQAGGQLIYGRVAGVQRGSSWKANLVDPGSSQLALPPAGQAISYAIDTLRGGRLGTNQVQAAPLVVRYPDTAYESHANYCVHYDLTLPLVNQTDRPRTVTVTLETPFKEDRLARGGLLFRQPAWDFPFFRGTVRVRYRSDRGQDMTRYLHLWHRRGQVLDPLVQLNLQPGEQRSVRFDFLYPPDSVPPQVLTIQ